MGEARDLHTKSSMPIETLDSSILTAVCGGSPRQPGSVDHVPANSYSVARPQGGFEYYEKGTHRPLGFGGYP